MRRFALIPASALLLCTAGIVWAGLLLPPPIWIVKYGFTPGCEPTGRSWEFEGVEFEEIGPGISQIGSAWLAIHREDGYSTGDLVGRLLQPIGLFYGEPLVPSNEMPVHWVEFGHGFAIARAEITNSQFERFRPEHVRLDWNSNDKIPVVNVSALDAIDYCVWLSKRTGFPVRLPSEAEWETAARAGCQGEYPWGNNYELIEEYAWYSGNASGRQHPVRRLRSSRWGLWDMHGNVFEWCADQWNDTYIRSPSNGSGMLGQDRLGRQVCRGGSAWSPHEEIRTAHRHWVFNHTRGPDVGFRPAFYPSSR